MFRTSQGPSSGCHNLFLTEVIKPLNAELNPICHLLALLGAHHILHVSKIRVKHHTVQNTKSRPSL
jgi:hypothetical protein